MKSRENFDIWPTELIVTLIFDCDAWAEAFVRHRHVPKNLISSLINHAKLNQTPNMQTALIYFPFPHEHFVRFFNPPMAQYRHRREFSK